jgi:hypothetical protein
MIMPFSVFVFNQISFCIQWKSRVGNKENSSSGGFVIDFTLGWFLSRLAPTHIQNTSLREQAQYFHIIRAATKLSFHTLSAQKAEKMLFCSLAVCVFAECLSAHAICPRAALCSPSWLLSHPN